MRMRLLRDHPSRPLDLTRCQLRNRHWVISEPARVGNDSVVDGEGVVGLFPQLSVEYSQNPDDDEW